MRSFASTAAFSLLASLLASACAEDFECTVDYECDGAQVCNVSSGKCETLECDTDDQCPNPVTQKCEKNHCIAATAK